MFVAGTAHLDILCTAQGDESVVDKIGSLSIEIGGTACNVATHVVKLGARPVFLTAMNDSPYSKIISDHLDECGVDAHIKRDPSLPMAAFSAHVSRTGELLSAVSSSPCEQYPFTPQDISSLMGPCAGAIMDTTLSVATMDLIGEAASAKNIPLMVCTVSEEKSLRLLEIKAKPSAVFINYRDARYLLEKRLGANASLEALAKSLGATLVVTVGTKGVVIITRFERIEIPAPRLEHAPANFLWAGDAFVAAAALSVIGSSSRWMDAGMQAMAFVEQLIANKPRSEANERSIERILAATDRKAHYDGMTQLLNRRSMEAAMERAIVRRSSQGDVGSIILLDIDHFKSVNDTFGHDVGDDVIRSVADVLRDVVRGEDKAGRWGGEEFLCVLPGATAEGAAMVAERVRSTVERAITRPRQITISAGVASYVKGERFSDTVKRADEALYESKRGGRNRVTVYGIPVKGVEKDGVTS